MNIIVVIDFVVVQHQKLARIVIVVVVGLRLVNALQSLLFPFLGVLGGLLGPYQSCVQAFLALSTSGPIFQVLLLRHGFRSDAAGIK